MASRTHTLASSVLWLRRVGVVTLLSCAARRLHPDAGGVRFPVAGLMILLCNMGQCVCGSIHRVSGPMSVRLLLECSFVSVAQP